MRRVRIGLPALCAGLAAVLILAGALIWYRPYMTAKRQVVAEVPEPAALFGVTPFVVPGHGQACMNAVTITPQSEIVRFGLRPVGPAPHGGPPIQLVLSAPGYHYVLHVPGGYPGGSVALPISPPHTAVVGTACFVNTGSGGVVLPGTVEPRTISRSSPTLVDGREAVGDIALSFVESRRQALGDRVGEIFAHASNLTDQLLPTWLIWLFVVLVAFGVPAAIVSAIYVALREAEAPATGV
jgi:hypothetical protein